MAANTEGWKDDGLDCLVLEEFLLPAPGDKCTRLTKKERSCDVAPPLEENHIDTLNKDLKGQSDAKVD